MRGSLECWQIKNILYGKQLKTSALAGVFLFHKIHEILSCIILNCSFHKSSPAKPYSFPSKSLPDPCAQPKSIAMLNDLSVFYSHKSFDVIRHFISCF